MQSLQPIEVLYQLNPELRKMGVADKVWGDYPVYYKQPLRVCNIFHFPALPRGFKGAFCRLLDNFCSEPPRRHNTSYKHSDLYPMDSFRC